MTFIKWFFVKTIGFILLVWPIMVNAKQISGYVTDHDDKALPWVEIRDLAGQWLGMTNQAGEFRVVVSEDNRNLILWRVGYAIDTLLLPATPDSSLAINHALRVAPISLMVNSALPGWSAEKIMDRVIRNIQIVRSTTRSYDLSFYHQLQFEGLEPGLIWTPGSGTAEIYGWFGFHQPDQFQEQIVLKEEHGSWLYLRDIAYPAVYPYWGDQYLYLDELTVLSPLAQDSREYYSFELLDSIKMDDYRVWVIAFYPQNTWQPLLSGSLYIQDSTFMVMEFRGEGNPSLCSGLRKDVSLEIQFHHYDSSAWLPVLQAFTYTMDSDLPGLPVIKVSQSMLFSYHRINQTSLLTENGSIMHKNGSTPLIREHVSHQSVPNLPLTQPHHRLRDDSTDLFVSMLNFEPMKKLKNHLSAIPLTQWSDIYHFNPIEGHYIGVGLDGKQFSRWTPLVFRCGYGLGDKKVKYQFLAKIPLSLNLHFNLEYFNSVRVLDFINSYSPVSYTYESLIFKEYNTDFIDEDLWAVGVDREWIPNLKSQVRFSLSNQQSVSYSTTWSILNRSRQPRIPLKIQPGRMVITELKLTYQNRKYDDYGLLRKRRPDLEFNEFSLYYAQGMANRLKSDFSFQQWHGSIWINRKPSPYWSFSLALRGGILWGDKVLQRGFHLPSDHPILSEPNSFKSIPGDYFVGDRYGCIFSEINTGHGFFHLIPFLADMDMRWNGFVYTQVGWMRSIRFDQPGFNRFDLSEQPIWEIGTGLGDIAGIFRVEFIFPVTHTVHCRWTVRIGSRIEF